MVIVKDQSSHLVYLNIMHKITNLWNFELNWSSKLKDNKERKNTLVTRSIGFHLLDFETSTSNSKGFEIKLFVNNFFLENYINSEGAVAHNVLYHQPLPITRYQVRFYPYNQFE